MSIFLAVVKASCVPLQFNVLSIEMINFLCIIEEKGEHRSQVKGHIAIFNAARLSNLTITRLSDMMMMVVLKLMYIYIHIYLFTVCHKDFTVKFRVC